MALWKIKPNSETSESMPVLFLDRDGVVNAERHYLSDPNQVEILPGVAEAMIRAHKAGFLLIGVSNQSGLGRGRFQHEDFEAVMTRLDELLAQQGAAFDGFYFCPHAPEDNCLCRKPLPGMLQEAGEHFNYHATGSWVIGDKMCDVSLGRDAGLGGILVLTGHGQSQQEEVSTNWPHDPQVKVVADLAEAVEFILQNGAGEKP